MSQEGRRYRAHTLQEAAERRKAQLPILDIHEKTKKLARSKRCSKVWHELKDGTTQCKSDKKGHFEGATVGMGSFRKARRKKRGSFKRIQSLFSLEAGWKTFRVAN